MIRRVDMKGSWRGMVKVILLRERALKKRAVYARLLSEYIMSEKWEKKVGKSTHPLREGLSFTDKDSIAFNKESVKGLDNGQNDVSVDEIMSISCGNGETEQVIRNLR